MKKWMYVIFPGVMLGLFLVVYFTHVEEAHAREQALIKKVADERAAEAEKKKQAEARAAEDAAKRAAEREAEDKKKEEDRRKKQEAADKDLRDRMAEASGRADKFSKEVNDLTVELDRLYKQREALIRESFEMAKQVEAARVAKRNAELQQQHLTRMIASRADTSAMAQVPPPPSR